MDSNASSLDWVELSLSWLRSFRDAAVTDAANKAAAGIVAPLNPRKGRDNKGNYLLQAYERCIASLEAEMSKNNELLQSVKRPADLACLKHFGPKICERLEAEAKSFLSKNGLEPLPIIDQPPAAQRARSEGSVVSQWLPRHGSTTYHVLLGLYSATGLGQSSIGIGKTELQRSIKPRLMLEMSSGSQKQMPNLTPSINTLVRREYVYTSNKRYHLTEDGIQIAGKLWSLENGGAAGRDSRSNSGAGLEAAESPPSSNQLHVEVWAPGIYKVLLLLDTREIMGKSNRSGFADGLAELDVETDLVALPAGDILWVAEHISSRKRAVLDVIVERKTLSDLVSSIIDGRFSEQKSRLKNSGVKRVVYLIEKIGSADLIAKNEQRIQTALSQIVVLNNFHLRESSGQNDTIAYLSAIHENLKELTSNGVTVVTPTLDSYLDDVTTTRTQAACSLGINYDVFAEVMTKSNSLNVGDVYSAMLQIIPTISSEKAWAIQMIYPTLKSLIEGYKVLDSEEERENMLWRETLENITRRRISAEASKNIYRAIWPS